MNIDTLNNATSALTENFSETPEIQAFVDPVADTMIKGADMIRENINTMGGHIIT